MEINCNNHVASFTHIDALGDEDYPLTNDPLSIPEGEYTFVYTYPLSTTAKFTHKLVPESSAINVLLLARADYEAIYKAEDDACGATANIPGMLNRSSSDGPYGIWGHDISDLYFECVEIDEATKTVSFGIGS